MPLPRSLPNTLIQRLGVPTDRIYAGRRGFPLWGVIHHRGRLSGREYRFPVAVLTRADEVVIPLLFGHETNWVKNVQADQGCQLRWKGRMLVLGRPEVLDLVRARPYFTRVSWAFSEQLVTPQSYLRLRRVHDGAAPSRGAAA